MEVAFGFAFVFAITVGTGIGVLLLAKPERVLSVIAETVWKMDNVNLRWALRMLARVPAYRWALRGDSVETFLDTAPDNPRVYNRMVGGIRAVGVVTVACGLAVWITMVVLVLAAWLGD